METKTQIKRRIELLREEKTKYKFPQKNFLRIGATIASLSRQLKPGYLKKQSKAGKKGSKNRWSK